MRELIAKLTADSDLNTAWITRSIIDCYEKKTVVKDIYYQPPDLNIICPRLFLNTDLLKPSGSLRTILKKSSKMRGETIEHYYKGYNTQFPQYTHRSYT